MATTITSSPTVYCMAGIPGAGKSTFVARAIESGLFPGSAFILDPDRVMLSMPEYKKDCRLHGSVAAFLSWEMPARNLAYRWFDDAIAQRRDIIKDMSCTRTENHDKLVAMKQAGYRLKMFYIECDPEEAIRRLSQRERYTPPQMIRERAASLQNLLPLYRALADEFTAIDNSDLSKPFTQRAA